MAKRQGLQTPNHRILHTLCKLHHARWPQIHMSFDHIIGGTTKIDGVLQGSKQGVKKGHKKVLNYLSHEGVVPKT